MSAPQWKGGKCKSIQQAKAWLSHNDKERREEHGHKNTDIRKDLTHLNFSYRGLSYDQLCNALDEKLDSVDMGRQSSGKNARVVMQSVILYPPRALVEDPSRLREWFERAGDVLNERYGDNFLDMQVDFDEIHEYIDPETRSARMSMPHGHVRLFPEIDGRLNAKAFSSRNEIMGLNDVLQEMSIKEFGCPMMDGSKKKGGKTVEKLKADSAKAQDRLNYLEGFLDYCNTVQYGNGKTLGHYICQAEAKYKIALSEKDSQIEPVEAMKGNSTDQKVEEGEKPVRGLETDTIMGRSTRKETAARIREGIHREGSKMVDDIKQPETDSSKILQHGFGDYIV